jgi:hypothetical protein
LFIPIYGGDLLSFPFLPDGGDKADLTVVFYGFFKVLFMFMAGLVVGFPCFYIVGM